MRFGKVPVQRPCEGPKGVPAQVLCEVLEGSGADPFYGKNAEVFKLLGIAHEFIPFFHLLVSPRS